MPRFKGRRTDFTIKSQHHGSLNLYRVQMLCTQEKRTKPVFFNPLFDDCDAAYSKLDPSFNVFLHRASTVALYDIDHDPDVKAKPIHRFDCVPTQCTQDEDLPLILSASTLTNLSTGSFDFDYGAEFVGQDEVYLVARKPQLCDSLVRFMPNVYEEYERIREK